MKSLLRHIGDTGQDVSKPGARINAVQLGSLDEAVHGGGALSALVGTCKEPSLPPKCRAAQHAFRGVIGQANTAITQEPLESPPTLQHVIHGLGKVIVARQLCPFGTHPCLKRDYQWRDVALTHRKPLSRRLAIDRGFGGEYRVNLAHGFNGQWHVMHLGQIEQFAPAVGPARRLQDRRWLSRCAQSPLNPAWASACRMPEHWLNAVRD